MNMDLQRFDLTQNVLHSKFDFAVHKATFIDYCEVVILEDGTIEYAVPSHERKLIDVFCRKFNLTEDDFKRRLVEKNMLDWYFEICSILSKCMLVANSWCRFAFIPTDKQIESLRKLAYNQCIDSSIFMSYDSNIRSIEQMQSSDHWQNEICSKIQHFLD